MCIKRLLVALMVGITLGLLLVEPAHAQYAVSQRQQNRLIAANIDSIQQRAQLYAARLDSLTHQLRYEQYVAPDMLANPYYASLLGNTTLYNSTLKRVIGQLMPLAEHGQMLASSKHIYQIRDASDHYLAMAYTCYPWLVNHQEVEEGTLNVDTQIRESVKPEITLTERFTEEAEDDVLPQVMPIEDDMNIIVRKPNFWTFKTNFSLMFTQNYVSDNWYKGGESHNALLAATVIEANYNNQRKVTFDNKLEMKLGFQSSHNDKEHKYKTNSDLIRLTNKLGLRASKHWYYTMMLQSWTQFYRGYKSDDPAIYSDFMSPFESLLSIGMDYQMTTKNNRFKVNSTFSPMALKLTYVSRPSLVGTFGIEQGKHTKWEVGSNVTINYSWEIAKNIKWAGRIYYFTDYNKTQVEWENTFNLAINKYLSTSLFLYPRFDDSLQREPGESYLQFNELLSLGLNVNF